MIELIKPDHRCKKCKTPLHFNCNHIVEDWELNRKYSLRLTKAKNWFERLLVKLRGIDRWEIDKNRQYWSCPKCYENYLVDLRGRKNE